MKWTLWPVSANCKLPRRLPFALSALRSSHTSSTPLPPSRSPRDFSSWCPYGGSEWPAAPISADARDGHRAHEHGTGAGEPVAIDEGFSDDGGRRAAASFELAQVPVGHPQAFTRHPVPPATSSAATARLFSRTQTVDFPTPELPVTHTNGIDKSSHEDSDHPRILEDMRLPQWCCAVAPYPAAIDLGDPTLQRSPILGGRVMTPGGRSDMGGPIGPTGHPGGPRSGITGQCQPS